MALQKARSFEYRPSRRRQEQLDPSERPRIQIPRAGPEQRSTGMMRLLIMLAAIIAVAFMLYWLPW